MLYFRYGFLVVWCAAGVSAAYGADAPAILDDKALSQVWRSVSDKWAESDWKVENDAPRVVDGDFLLAHPKMLEHSLRDALNGNQADLIASLADLYAKLPDYDAVLYGRAQALLAKLAGRPAEAVARYRKLHGENAADERILLDLAAAEFDDFRLKSAERHFAEAAKLDLPSPVLENVGRFRKKTEGLTGWRFSGGISPAVNQNANNAAPQYCRQDGGSQICSVSRAERATGLNYEIEAEKLTALADNHYLLFRSNISGTSYYFSKKSAYDDGFGRAYLGWQRKDGKQTVSVLPFYQAQLAGSSEFDSKKENNRRAAPYMLAHGVGVQLSHMVHLGNATQLYYSLERYRQNYRETDRALRNDGWHDSTYLSLARRFGRTTLFGGWQYNRFVPENKNIRNAVNNAAYHRNGFNIGWIQQWQVLGGLNSRLTASFANRRYKGIMAFGTESQRNRERSLSISLSHNKLSYKGITPTLNYSYSHIRSNAPYAMRNIHQWSLGGEWNF